MRQSVKGELIKAPINLISDMNKILFLFVLTCISDFAFSQQKSNPVIWHLTIVDSTTSKGVDRATVSINKNKNFSTDINGAIDINKTLINPKDNIRISCMGYKSIWLMSGIDNKYPDTIRLSSSVISLKEVKVSSLNRQIEIGDIKKSYNSHRTTSPNDAYAQFIPNERKIKGTISSVEYVLNDELHGIEMPFRVRLYTKNKSNLSLDQELTNDSIIVYNPEKKRLVSVDLLRYNIQLPEDGIIVVFETLDSSYYSKDPIRYMGYERVRLPGIDMDLKKKNDYTADLHDKSDRKGSYSMVGPTADRWNFDDAYDQWYAYADGNNFAITVTINSN
jgi:hypothetical protein